MKKLLSVLGTVFTVLLMVFSITITAMTVISVRSEIGVPNIGGYALMNVETDSMESENGFFVGDMIIVHILDDDAKNHLKVGDVITFRRMQNGMEYLETHRIVANNPEADAMYKLHEGEIVDGVWVHGGVSYYVTRGDNTPGYDYIQNTGDLEFPCYTDIVGVWEGTRIPKLGGIMKFLRSQMGFMVCVVIPVALFFIYQLYVFIITLTSKKKEEALAAVAGKEEELKAQAVAEFLAQQQAAQAPAAEQTPPPESAPAQEPKAEAPTEKKEEAKPADPAPEISEEDKARIIAEYMAKQAEALHKKDNEE